MECTALVINFISKLKNLGVLRRQRWHRKKEDRKQNIKKIKIVFKSQRKRDMASIRGVPMMVKVYPLFISNAKCAPSLHFVRSLKDGAWALGTPCICLHELG